MNRTILRIIMILAPHMAYAALPQASPSMQDFSMQSTAPTDDESESVEQSDQAEASQAPALPGMAWQQQAMVDAGQSAAPQTVPAPAEPGMMAAGQLSWPDTVSFSEDQEGLASSDNPEIINLFKQTSDPIEKMTAIIDQMVKTRADLYQKYFDLISQLDDFSQKTNASMGEIQVENIKDN